jgi:predicted MFS family arabinose efflux permease
VSASSQVEHNHRVALVLVYGLAAFTSVLNITMLSPLLVPIAAEFSRSEARTGQLSTITALFAFGTAILIAPLLDRYPRRAWLRAQVVLVAVAAGLTAAADSFAMVMASRVLAGVGGAIIISICYASAADNFPDARQRSRVVGMIASAAALGSILGLPIIAIVADWIGWRWAALFVVPLSVLVLIGAGHLREMPASNHAAGAKQWARKYRNVLAQRSIASLLGVMVAILIARFGWFVYLGAYGEEALDASATTLGFAFAAGGIAHVIGSNATPVLLARYSPRRIATTASAVMALDLVSVGLYSNAVWSLFLFVIVFAVCWAICLVSLSIYLLDMNPEARSTVSALQSAAMELGIGAGAAIGGLLLSTFDDYERAFRSLALVIPVGLLLLALSSRKPDAEWAEALPVPAQAPAP